MGGAQLEPPIDVTPHEDCDRASWFRRQLSVETREEMCTTEK